MRTYGEAFATAKDESAFSNGEEGHAWTARWCDTCIHDKGTRDGTDARGCALLCVALMGRTPQEWIEQPWGERGPRLGDTFHCIEYREDDTGGDDGDGPDVPPPPSYDVEMPGQTTIFEALTDQAVIELSREAVGVHGQG